MNKSESIAALAEAMAQAQSEIENASKNAANPHFKSKYADLAEVLNTARPVLSKHGIAVIQFPSFAEGVASVETVITHKSGEWMSNICFAPVTKQDAQGVGSAITYLRRYSLAAVAGIAQEDDDANQASQGAKSGKISVTQIAKEGNIDDSPVNESKIAGVIDGAKEAINDDRPDDVVRFWRSLTKNEMTRAWPEFNTNQKDYINQAMKAG
jgi:hypothetical protein